MCGIWLVLSFKRNTLELLEHFNNVKHRGPDAYRVESIPELENSCIGFHRLAIIGGRGGMQPMSHPQFPHLHVVCNGEIYNYKMLTKKLQLDLNFDSDIECVFHLYEKFGVDKMARYLDGMFAMAFVDCKRKKAFLIRDPLGIRPLYFLRYSDGCIMAASEAKSLVFTDSSVKCHIEVVQPGTIIEMDLSSSGANICDIRNFYHLGQYPEYLIFLPVTITDNVFSNIRNLLKNAVRKRLITYRKIGCLLSGGLDSSIIAGLICEIMKESSNKDNFQGLETFSVGMCSDGMDNICARKVAVYLNTTHRETTFTFADIIKELSNIIYSLESFDPCSIRASIGLYFLCKYVKNNSDCAVIITGEGSDELAWGYEHFHEIKNSQKSQEESDRLLRNLHYFDVRRSDSCISRWGMEGRVPFLDHTFLAYYKSLQPSLKQPKDGMEKWLLRKAFDNNNFLPDDILWRKKVPFGMGLESANKDMLKEQLDEYFNSKITDAEFEEMRSKYAFQPPQSKQDLYYRNCFEQFFPEQYALCPKSWQ